MRKNTAKDRRKNPVSRQGDISTLMRTDSPDDAEFAAPLAPGDPDSLVAIDSPDDIEDRARRKRAQRKPQDPEQIRP